VVVPPAVRSALVEHAEAESPNEACGVVVFKDGEAERYIPGTNLSESPYRYELQVPPDTWFLEDDGYELAVFHSHVSSPPRPSRTDVENIGLWEGKPYLILSLRARRLADRRRADQPRARWLGDVEAAAHRRRMRVAAELVGTDAERHPPCAAADEGDARLLAYPGAKQVEVVA
jgi:proteasome lid subunit RPN8/RPN11